MTTLSPRCNCREVRQVPPEKWALVMCCCCASLLLSSQNFFVCKSQISIMSQIAQGVQCLAKYRPKPGGVLIPWTNHLTVSANIYLRTSPQGRSHLREVVVTLEAVTVDPLATSRSSVFVSFRCGVEQKSSIQQFDSESNTATRPCVPNQTFRLPKLQSKQGCLLEPGLVFARRLNHSKLPHVNPRFDIWGRGKCGRNKFMRPKAAYFPILI